MKFRTKLFFTWGGVVLALWAATLWPLRHTILLCFNRMADTNFADMRQSLHQMQEAQAAKMRQAGAMVMSVPDFRSLIAESNNELNTANASSLQERLDTLTEVLGVKFICVMDARGSLVAQNSTSPWASIKDLNDFMLQSPEVRALVRNVFGVIGSGSRADRIESGMWISDGKLYHVVGLPLVFSEDQTARPDAALILASPLTDVQAASLSFSHGCEISFLGDTGAFATSLPISQRQDLLSQNRQTWPALQPFDLKLAGAPFRAYSEPLIDPCSKTVLGTTLIQTSMVEESALEHSISRALLLIMTIGLIMAAALSFVLSNAVSRPVKLLVDGARKVGRGDLEGSIVVKRRDELGELASAFNEMIVQLRTRRELQLLVQQSQAATKAKSQFLANMSHEIRTPLHGVIGLANLLLGTELTDRQRHYAQLVRSSTEVLTTLINDILDFSKIEAGKLDLETVEFNLHQVVEDVVELLSPKALEKKLEIASDIAADVPLVVKGDPTRLRQILLNLVNNALKFTERGHVVVRIRRQNTADDKPQLRLCVIDTGMGIPADRLDRLFKSFSQVDASTTRRFGGTGLGLAISKQLIELMGGTIGVQSEYGHGSTFYFNLTMDAVEKQSKAPAMDLGGKRALVADANPMVRIIIRQLLTDAGIYADAAGDAEQARQLAARAAALGQPYSLLLVDGSLPDVAGLIHDLQMTCVMLAHADDELQDDELQLAGFAAAVEKPVRRTQLLAVVSQVLGLAPKKTVKPKDEIASSIASTSGSRFRILVAEDNEVNRIVAADFLAKAEYDSQVVCDGEQAVNAFGDGKFDLILMDCQMPKMDGFEATRAIRANEHSRRASGETLRPIPIIALTANASGADRSKCLEAGMNAYCGKPFRPRELLDTIRSLLSDNTPAEIAPPAASPENAVDPPPINIPALMERCTGNSTLAMTILDKFQQQAQTALDQISAQVRDNNAIEAAKTLHMLKGTAGVIEAGALRTKLAKMEQMARTDALAEAQKDLDELREEIDRCTAFLPSARSQLQTTI